MVPIKHTATECNLLTKIVNATTKGILIIKVDIK